MRHEFDTKTIAHAADDTCFVLLIDWTDDSVRLADDIGMEDANRPRIEVWSDEGGTAGRVRALGLSRLSPTLFEVLKLLLEYLPRVGAYDLVYALPDQPFMSGTTVAEFNSQWQPLTPTGPFELFIGGNEWGGPNHAGGTLLHVHPGAAAAHAVALARAGGTPTVQQVSIQDRGNLLVPPESAASAGGLASVIRGIESGAILLQGTLPPDAIRKGWALKNTQWIPMSADTPATRLRIHTGWHPDAITGILRFDMPSSPLPPTVIPVIEAVAEGLHHSRTPQEWIAAQFHNHPPRHKAAFLRVVYALTNRPAAVTMQDPALNEQDAEAAWATYRERFPYVGSGPDSRSAAASSSIFAGAPGCAGAAADPRGVLLALFYPASFDPPVLRLPGAAVVAPLFYDQEGGLVTVNGRGEEFQVDRELWNHGVLMLPAIWQDDDREVWPTRTGAGPGIVVEEASVSGILVFDRGEDTMYAYRGDGDRFGHTGRSPGGRARSTTYPTDYAQPPRRQYATPPPPTRHPYPSPPPPPAGSSIFTY